MASVDKKVIARLTTLIERAENEIASTRLGDGNKLYNVPSKGYVNRSLFVGWQANMISFLDSVFGKNHVIYKAFLRECPNSNWECFIDGVEIAKAALDELENGFLGKIETLVNAEVFSDFLEMAEHYLSLRHKDPAAFLSGAVLEDSLKKIARLNNVTVKDNDDLSTVNQKLVQAKVYSEVMRKQIQVWNTIRNHADHAEFDKYEHDDVSKMIEGIRNFMSNYF